MRGGEDLEIPGGGYLGDGFGEGGEGWEGRARVACCVDEDLAGFEVGCWVVVVVVVFF